MIIIDFTESQEAINAITADLLPHQPISLMTIIASGILLWVIIYLTVMWHKPHYYENFRIARSLMHHNLELSFTETELNGYILSIADRCRTLANSHQVKLKVIRNADYIHCKINETFMTAALLHLLSQMIKYTVTNGCINIIISHYSNCWKLSISNHPDNFHTPHKLVPPLSTILPLHPHNSLKIIKSIIRQHGGKISGSNQENKFIFQIIVPKDCSPNKRKPVNISQAKTTDAALPHLLFIMTDKQLSSYLLSSFSSQYRTTLLESPECLSTILACQRPDTIIIDESIKGIYGNELCLQIKSMKSMADIPVILLINSLNMENYRAHIACGADKLELRTTNINKLKADIRILINKQSALCGCHKYQSDTETGMPSTKIEETDNEDFLIKVNNLIEENFSTEEYTIAKLSKDIGMSKTRFSNKIKEITKMPPSTYILSFKMDKARELLLSQQYSINEIASILGFCDAKYFARKFKECNNDTPSDYAKKTTD